MFELIVYGIFCLSAGFVGAIHACRRGRQPLAWLLFCTAAPILGNVAVALFPGTPHQQSLRQ